MNNEEIIKFRESITDCSLEELESKAQEIRDAISKMVLDSDLVIKAAIVDTLIKQKKECDA